MLEELPVELQLVVILNLQPRDLTALAKTNSHFANLCQAEPIWINLAYKNFAIKPQVAENFSPRLFYQQVLHPYRHMLGTWQRKNLKYYGGMLSVTCHDDCILFQEIIPPSKLQEPLKKIAFLRLTHNLNQLGPLFINLSKIAQTDKIQLNHDRIVNDKDEEEEELRIILSDIEDHTLNPTEWRAIMLDFMQLVGDEVQVNDLLLMKFIQSYHSRALYTYKRLNLHWSHTSPAAFIEPGIFMGTYGPHGMEVINLVTTGDIVGTAGTKVTGDPNVPFGEITFRITDPGCLNIPLDIQDATDKLTEFLEEPSYIEYQEGLRLDFKLPAMCFERETVKYDKCMGRWSCECQVAAHGFRDPSFIKGNFIQFEKDIFGVLFLDIRSISLYRRVTNEF